MTRAFVGIGSSIDPEENLLQSLRSLAKRSRLVGVSTIYRTEAIRRPGDPPFLNCVVEVETDLPPDRLEHEVLKAIEQERGRVRGGDPWGPRTADLDLLAFRRGGETTITRPEDLGRPFVAAALAELDPGLVPAGSGAAALEPLPALTEDIRRRVLNGDQHSADRRAGPPAPGGAR